ncbi:MAG: hypothetical protein Q8M24_25715 [Pseudolabrys sp.]|nr:hypothetical protein [Pseudolabrys sp.]MDP2298852.1 hypothetical protein [Pseudolabrys sp.]
MTGDKNGGKSSKSGQSSRRDARLAAALRENLRRRKAQERARGAEERGRGAQGDSAAGKPAPGDENPP